MHYTCFVDMCTHYVHDHFMCTYDNYDDYDYYDFCDYYYDYDYDYYNSCSSSRVVKNLRCSSWDWGLSLGLD